MFEAADPEVFGWYIKNYGPEVNVFVDHSQIVLLECLRSGIWGTKSLWGRIVTYKWPVIGGQVSLIIMTAQASGKEKYRTFPRRF